MINENIIAKRRIEANKSETALIKATVIIAVSTLFTVLSLCVNYLKFFVQHAASLTNNSLPQVLKNSVSNFIGMAKYTLKFIEYYASMPETVGDSFQPIPVSDNADKLFSPEAIIENLPLTIILMLTVTLIAVYSALSIVFSVCQRNRQGFYSTLIASGASDKFIKKCTFYETLYYCSPSVYIGLLLGAAEMFLLELVSERIFISLSEKYGDIVLPVNIRPSGEIAFFVVLPLIYLTVGFFSRRVSKKLTAKSITTNAKKSSTGNIGIRAMTANSKNYKRLGIEFYVAMRNFQCNIGKYFRIIFLSVMYVILIGATFIIFSTMRSFNGHEIINGSKEMLSFSFAAEIFICAVSLAMATVTLVSTFCAVSANINSNIGEYALMKSSGASTKSILKAVRIEGGFCVFFGIIMSVGTMVFFTAALSQIYREDTRVAVTETGPTAAVVGFALLFFVLSVCFTIAFTNRKMKNINLVETLKDLFY